jgi:outer membrane protein assembly factor BamB
MRFVVLASLIAACSDAGPNCDSWLQWGKDAAHAGDSCVSGQPLDTALADLVYDPFTPQEVADAGGDLIIHYQAPLIDGDDVYMMTKTGAYTPCNTVAGQADCFEPVEMFRLHTQVWTERAYRWSESGELVERWSFDSDWKPEPFESFEPMFQPALYGDLIAIPMGGGELALVDRESGQLALRVRPFGSPIDRDRYVAGGIAVAADRTIYYNVIKLDHDDPLGKPSEAHLVVVDPDGEARTVSYADLSPTMIGNATGCYGTFDFKTTPLPWPPPPNADGSPALPMQVPCGPARPGINSTPAVGADGTVFVVARAHFAARYSQIIAIGRDLKPKWATSLRDLLADGCGVTVPFGTGFFDCRPGAMMGVEPATNLPPAARVDDESSSSPVALPDGGVMYGAFTGYNGSRGHLIKLDRDGKFVGAYDFGWDTTPAVVGTGADYKIVLKDNHYGQDDNGVDLGPYFITELDASLNVVWQFKSTETQSCIKAPDGTVQCADDHPHGFEWCINAPAVDKNGVVYANSEDGHIYAVAADGTLRDRFFLDRALGAAYTPLALDRAGRVFALNNGHMTVIGSSR